MVLRSEIVKNQAYLIDMEIDLLGIVSQIQREKEEAHRFPSYALQEEVTTRIFAQAVLEIENLVKEGKLEKKETLNSFAYTLKI